MGDITANCLKKSNFITSFLSKKKLYFTQKVTHYPILKVKVSQVLALCLIESRSQNPIISIIIDFDIIDHFFRNHHLVSTYIKYKHKFETGTREKIVAHGDDNIDLKITDLTRNTNILIVTNVSWVPELGRNLLSTIH